MIMSGKKAKLNCWEFERCGRELAGSRVFDLGVCPVALESKLNGVHNGMNAGRSCWVVAGTFCKGDVQGTFAQKCKNCEQCDFYMTVREEERPDFSLSVVLLDKLRVSNEAS
jgi:hypothetical protein